MTAPIEQLRLLLARHRILRAWAALASLLWVSSCGNAGDGTNQNGTVKYYLERSATNTLENTLILEVDGNFKPSFSLGGTGYSADVSQGALQAFKQRTELTVDAFGEASIELTLYQENGQAYLTDTLVWESSDEVPPEPEPYFSEAASSDAYVYLILPSSRGRNVQEVWVEGDVEPGEGQYYAIPNDDQVLLQLTAADGMKTLSVKYRNIFGTEGTAVTASILKKSQGPQDCKATPVASKTASGLIRTRIEAVNEGPLFYKISGDLETERDFVTFTDSIEEYIALSAGEGVKDIVVKIKDEAGNFCDDIPLSIAYDRSYRPGSLAIEGDLIWTDDPTITILPQFDFLEGDAITMHISGGVLDDASTFEWIPYQSELPVTLTPNDGTRFIIVQFKKDDTVVSEVSLPIYLRPFVLVSGSAPNQTISVSNIVGATSLTITGCSQSYQNVAYASSYACTKVANEVTVTFFLNDGTSVSRSAPL